MGNITDRKRRGSWIRDQKHWARTQVTKAVKEGLIERPLTCDCCGEFILPSYLLQAHHTDYNEPYDVEWLCSTCHAEREQQRNSEYGDDSFYNADGD